jgi:hypothetical protein
VDGQPADVAYSAYDGVQVGDQDVITDAGQRYILSKGSAQDNVRIVGLDEGKNSSLQNI